MAGTLLLTACQSSSTSGGSIIEKPSVKVENGIMNTDVLMAFGRISDPAVSPDKQKVLYGVSYVDVAQNKSNRELMVVNIDGSGRKQLTHTAGSELNGVWIDGGDKIAFLSAESGSYQLWVMNADGSHRRQISHLDRDIQGFLLSPDETQILLICNIKAIETASDIYPDLDKATGRVIDDLMYKHWNEWVEEIPHPYIASFDGEKIGELTDLLEGEPYESPMKPFGGTESFSWSPDGKSIAYVCRKKTGLEYSLSTNSDIYLYDIASKTSRNLTEGMMGYDTNPSFSADGKYLLWTSMEHDGYESDKNRVFVLDMATGEKNYLTSDFDYSADGAAWAPDNRSVYFSAPYRGEVHLFNVTLADKTIKQITTGYYDYGTFIPVSDRCIVATRHSLSQPDEIYTIDPTDLSIAEISFENKEILDQVTMGRVEERWIKTTDNKEMLAWVVYPPNFDPNKKYPALLYCQGGPQSPVSQFWSYRWNLQMMAANGYRHRTEPPGLVRIRTGMAGTDQRRLRRSEYERLPERKRCSGERTVCRCRPYGCCGGKLRRVLGLLAGRTPQRPVQGFHRSCRHLQHRATIFRNRRDVVRQLGYGRRSVGKGQQDRPTDFRQFSAQVRRQMEYADSRHSRGIRFPHPRFARHVGIQCGETARRTCRNADLPG